MKIAFLGVGIMGRPMAGHLAAAGHHLLLVKHKSDLPQELLDGGATVCATAAQAAANADVIILMLPDTPDVERALFGAGGVAEGLSAGKTVIDMSSIDPDRHQGFRREGQAKGCDYVDAPVSGGEVGAKAASLTIMCGADDAVFERVRPLFETMGKNITLVGGVGAGQITKVANQIIVALNIEAVVRGPGVRRQGGRRSGQGAPGPDGRVRRLAHSGGARRAHAQAHLRSRVPHRPAPEGSGPGARLGKALGVALPNTANAQQLFSACVAHGGAGWDHSAMVKALGAAGRPRTRIVERRLEGDRFPGLGGFFQGRDQLVGVDASAKLGLYGLPSRMA